MAIAIANKDQKQAREILSDAIGISLLFGLVFGVATYFTCPAILKAMTGSASSEMLAPAISYVQIRCQCPSKFVLAMLSSCWAKRGLSAEQLALASLHLCLKCIHCPDLKVELSSSNLQHG